MKKQAIVLAVLLFSLGCAHREVARGGFPSEAKERSLYGTGLKELTKGNSAAAAKNFAALLDQYPTTVYLPLAFYNWGLALEAQKQYPEAIEKYKRTIAFYDNTLSANEAQALYRLSICYEAVDDDPKALMTLLELEKQKAFLSKKIADTEVPARLAGAYARQGNPEQAKIYYKMAETGLKALRRSPLGADTTIWLPKALYSMGHIAPATAGMKPADFHNYTASLIQSQTWLLQCAELNDSAWSKKAADDLISDYQSAWRAIDEYPGPQQPDKLQAMKARQDDQRAMGADLDAAIEQFKIDRLPISEGDAPVLDEVFKEIKSIEDRLNILLQSPDVQDQVTPEAQKREGLRREGEIKH